MKNFLKKIVCIFLISFSFKVDQAQSLVPYYYFPTIKNIERESLSIGKYAYQVLYFGQLKKVLT